MTNTRIGVIGGTGLYSLEGLEILENKEISTPFGKPSAPLTLGRYQGKEVAFLPRHGLHHEFLPSEINFRANIWALKSLGVRRILSVSATGSLAQEIEPGHLAVASQYFDFTKGRRAASFFGEGLSAHISTAEPACAVLSDQVKIAAKKSDIPLHTAKTYACVEGPRLGTRAESFFLRDAGCHIVGMTNVPEAFLAREAQVCYCTIAVATDYDCWLEDPNEHASADQIIARYMQTLGKVKTLLGNVLSQDLSSFSCSCRKSLQGALMSKEDKLSKSQREIWNFLRE